MERPSSEHHVKPAAWFVAAAIVAASIGGAVFVTEWKPMTRARQGVPVKTATLSTRFVLPLERPNLPPPVTADAADPSAALSTGVTRLLAGDAAGAIDPLDAAVRLSTGAAEQSARWYLAVALERAGRVPDAIEVLDGLCREQGPTSRACVGLTALRGGRR